MGTDVEAAGDRSGSGELYRLSVERGLPTGRNGSAASVVP